MDRTSVSHRFPILASSLCNRVTMNHARRIRITWSAAPIFRADDADAHCFRGRESGAASRTAQASSRARGLPKDRRVRSFST